MKLKTVLAILMLGLVILAGCKNKTTEPDTSLPSVHLYEATQVNVGLPTLMFLVESAGASPLIKLTLCWGELTNPDLNGSHQNFSPSSSDSPYLMGMSLYQLTPGTTYYARVYAQNSDGEKWSNEVSFTTLPLLWDKIDLGISNHLTRVHFTSDTKGWICGSSGLLRKTLNGGTSWTNVNLGNTAYLLDMHWVDSNYGWIVGMSPNILLKTVNGGNTWSQVNLDFEPDNHLQAVYFENPQTGYLLTCYGGVHKTTNGGTSWARIRNDGEWTYNDIWSSGETIIIAGQGIRISDNGGQTWRAQLVTSHEYYGITFREPSTLWVAGDNEGRGALYRSDDLGATWTSINTNSDHAIRSISYAPNSQKLWLSGDYGNIRESTDDGMNWQINYNLFNTVMLYSVFAQSETRAWIAGQSGTLLRLKEQHKDFSTK